jgi:catechol 2,3-dioxygenase-like lactoylglutathione lyase family enzyme
VFTFQKSFGNLQDEIKFSAMSAISLHHVQLPYPVNKGSETYRFYADYLGLKGIGGGSSGRFSFDLGGTWLNFAPSPVAVNDVIAQLAFHVLDLPTLRHRLLQAGFVLEESQALPGYRRFFVYDPAGNHLEILEPEPHGSFTV